MTQKHHTHQFTRTEEAITVLFCLIDDAYANLNPRGRRYESLKRLSDLEIITLALFQQVRGIESERSFLRDAERFFSHLFPGVVGLAPSSFHRRLRRLRCFLEPLRRAIVAELAGDPETLLVDSTLLTVMLRLSITLNAQLRHRLVRLGRLGQSVLYFRIVVVLMILTYAPTLPRLRLLLTTALQREEASAPGCLP